MATQILNPRHEPALSAVATRTPIATSPGGYSKVFITPSPGIANATTTTTTTTTMTIGEELTPNMEEEMAVKDRCQVEARVLSSPANCQSPTKNNEGNQCPVAQMEENRDHSSRISVNISTPAAASGTAKEINDTIQNHAEINADDGEETTNQADAGRSDYGPTNISETSDGNADAVHHKVSQEPRLEDDVKIPMDECQEGFVSDRGEESQDEDQEGTDIYCGISVAVRRKGSCCRDSVEDMGNEETESVKTEMKELFHDDNPVNEQASYPEDDGEEENDVEEEDDEDEEDDEGDSGEEDGVLNPAPAESSETSDDEEDLRRWRRETPKDANERQDPCTGKTTPLVPERGKRPKAVSPSAVKPAILIAEDKAAFIKECLMETVKERAKFDPPTEESLRSVLIVTGGGGQGSGGESGNEGGGKAEAASNKDRVSGSCISDRLLYKDAAREATVIKSKQPLKTHLTAALRNLKASSLHVVDRMATNAASSSSSSQSSKLPASFSSSSLKEIKEDCLVASAKTSSLYGGDFLSAVRANVLARNAISGATGALWSGTNRNRDVSTGPLARPFARSLAPLTRSLAPNCSLRSRPPLRSLVRSLTRSLARSRRLLPRSWERE